MCLAPLKVHLQGALSNRASKSPGKQHRYVINSNISESFSGDTLRHPHPDESIWTRRSSKDSSETAAQAHIRYSCCMHSGLLHFTSWGSGTFESYANRKPARERPEEG